METINYQGKLTDVNKMTEFVIKAVLVEFPVVTSFVDNFGFNFCRMI